MTIEYRLIAHFVCAAALALSVGCTGPAGSTGPAGPQGPAGPPGTVGAPGAAGPGTRLNFTGVLSESGQAQTPVLPRELTLDRLPAIACYVGSRETPGVLIQVAFGGIGQSPFCALLATDALELRVVLVAGPQFAREPYHIVVIY